MTYGFLLVFALITGMGAYVLIKKSGQTQEKLTKEEEINEAVRKGLEVRDRLQRDADFARRVRDRFTR